MKFTPTKFPDVILIEPRVFGDSRGFFMETYQAQLFNEAGIQANFVQDNHSGSQQGILRGLHLWIPAGYAHGFYVTSTWAEFTYKVTDYYAPQYERSLLWNDPQLAIEWPLVDGQPPLLSTKDANGKPLSEAEVYEE
jgi:dTDP-4-dehydrorhamnose 3,5-epimerase